MCEIVINPERLKHFPKTVPMNIREAILVVAQILIRIHMEQATKTAPLECGQKDAIPETAPHLCKKAKPRPPPSAVVPMPR